MKTNDLNEKIIQLLKDEYRKLNEKYEESEKFRNILECEVRENDDLIQGFEHNTNRNYQTIKDILKYYKQDLKDLEDIGNIIFQEGFENFDDFFNEYLTLKEFYKQQNA